MGQRDLDVGAVVPASIDDDVVMGPPDVPRPVPVRRRRVAALLLVLAALAWPATVTLLSWSTPSIDGLAVYALFAVFDLVAALILLGPRPGPPWLVGGYAGVRLLIAAGSMVVPSAICYLAVALLLLRPAPAPLEGRADGPHPYQPLAEHWYTSLTPLWWSRTPFGAAQRGMAQCAVCGGAADDQRHSSAR